MTELLHRGARLETYYHEKRVPRDPVTTCDFYRKHVLGVWEFRRDGTWSSIWDDEASDDWLSITRSLLTLLWTSSPHLLADETHLSGGCWRTLTCCSSPC